ncbi:hypothetical protein DCD76_18250, partial [Acinetobacter baumannii]
VSAGGADDEHTSGFAVDDVEAAVIDQVVEEVHTLIVVGDVGDVEGISAIGQHAALHGVVATLGRSRQGNVVDPALVHVIVHVVEGDVHILTSVG